ncbi:MAG: hypothetical protein LBI77_01390, partial [Puniceicoccales bacterium]|nr:hypothetical protein [Puniceicoccales bacterium]
KIELTEREKAILGGVGNFYGFLCGIYNKTSGKEYNSLTSAHTYLRDAQKEHLGKGGYSLLKALDTLIAVAVQELFSNPNIQVRNKIKQFLSYTMKSLMPEMPRNDSAQAYLSSIARNMSLAGFNFAI